MAAAAHVGSWFCICRGLLFLITTNFEETQTSFKTPTSSSTPSDDTIIWSRLNTQSGRFFSVCTAVYCRATKKKQSRRWTAMKENSAISVRKAFPQAKPTLETGDVSSLDIQRTPAVWRVPRQRPKTWILKPAVKRESEMFKSIIILKILVIHIQYVLYLDFHM